MSTALSKRFTAFLSVGLLALAATSAVAAPRAQRRENPSRWAPTTFFTQAGTGDERTHAFALGATWEWNWSRQYRLGRVTGYTEAAFGRWRTENVSVPGMHSFTQFGATPVLRFFPTSVGNNWFAEVGIGANYITPVYRAGSKSFSTEFNFGDHFAFGRMLDDRHRSSVSLRFQHFSNGGIDAPNPGENFTQLRYSYRY